MGDIYKMDYIPYIQDLINNNKALSKIRAGINTIKNGGNNTPMINPVIIPENPNAQIGGIDVATQKNSLIDNIANGINDFQLGFKENYNTGFNPSNLTDQKFSPIMKKNKGFMGRIGEAVGTARRAFDKPVVQGVANGLAMGLMSANPMIGLIAGLNSANNAGRSQIYSKVLRDYGFDVQDSPLTMVNKDDYNSLMGAEYKQLAHNLAMQKLLEAQNYHQGLIDTRKERNNIYKNKPTRASTQNKVTQQDGWNEALAGYITRRNDERYSDKLDRLKASFISKYGVDPEKYVKD